MDAAPLPVKSDFISHPDDLDQNCAWEHFGGLTLEQATARFAENSLYYQEDFMFMGNKAFLFYFPVLDHYLRHVPDEENDDDYESWIISQCIRAQFDSPAVAVMRPLIPKIVDLAEFVRDNIRRFGCDHDERQRVFESWGELVQFIESLENTSGE